MDRIKIYIDGANFYHGLKCFNKPDGQQYFDFYLDLPKLINLKIQTNSRKIIGIHYYNAAFNQQRYPKKSKMQSRWFDYLRNQGFEITICPRRKEKLLIKNAQTERIDVIKEDDIHLAIDMLDDCFEDKFDIAILFSGDGDFVPLIKKIIKKYKKEIILYYFEQSISFKLLKSVSDNIIHSDNFGTHWKNCYKITRGLARTCYFDLHSKKKNTKPQEK